MDRAPSQRSLRLWMGLAFAAVAAALGAVNLILALQLVPQAQKSAVISERYGRCVALLGAMRGRLSDLRGAIALAHAPEPGRDGRISAAETNVAVMLGALRDLQREYVPLAEAYGQLEQWRPIGDERLPRLEKEAEAALEELRRTPGRDVAITTVLVDAEETDRALEHLEDLNAWRAAGAAVQVETALRRSARGAAVLALLGSGAALAMFLLAHVALGRWASAAERRAADLEAFASRVAHDLRTPLQTVVLAFASIARASPQVEGTCAKGRRSVERLQGLIEDLLAFSRAGARPELGAAAPVRVILEELREELEPRAEASGAALRIAADAGLVVAASRGAFRAIASNLIENALKYIGQGSERRVEVEARPDGPQVRLEVRDTGPGIPPDVVPHIFEPFFRATRGPDGLGIGLATVRRLVEAHGGRVRVASTPGRGTTFVVLLPRAG